MSRNSSDFDNWKQFAGKDYRQLCGYVTRKWDTRAWTDVHNEFCSSLHLPGQVKSFLWDQTLGKAVGAIGGGPAAVLGYADFISKMAGAGYIAGFDFIHGNSKPTRQNPISLTGVSLWSGKYHYEPSYVKNYVAFMLYYYPRDRDRGYRGFRWGDTSNKNPLPKT